ncbi:MAG: dihydrodipicolinate synthase family protein [Devosia sp.]|nr:dihydrodipicolinate synthase family protein [Devosia sp.]
MMDLALPNPDRTITNYRLTGVPMPPARYGAADFPRVAFAAAHVVADPLAACDPWDTPAIDWEATLALRHRLWDLGFGVAEAMDTAQRGMGLGWPEARELIARSLAEARSRPDALIACGAGTDHLAPGAAPGLEAIAAAYEEQIEAIEALGGRIILMASRALAAAARSPDDYRTVYGRLLAQVRQPVILHWLGEMFDPALAGYWGHADHDAAMDVCLDVIAANAGKVDGVKISLLSRDKEIAMRRRLPPGVRMYTGDDFNYPELIAGDGQGHSDALLGIFDGIAPIAAAALAALGRGHRDAYFELFEPTVPLSRHIFASPTRYYKTGLVFLAYLNGAQSHFTMIGGQQSARSLQHLAELFRLADRARALTDPELAVARMRRLLAVHGID